MLNLMQNATKQTQQSSLNAADFFSDRLYLRHLKIFPQPTVYAIVLGYIKALQDRWGGFTRIKVDFTREGPSFIADMQDAGIRNAEGVNFSVPRKCEMASVLKQRMLAKQFFYPLLNWERPYRGDICTEPKRRTLRFAKRRKRRLLTSMGHPRRRILGYCVGGLCHGRHGTLTIFGGHSPRVT